jgi:hypothetical protein
MVGRGRLEPPTSAVDEQRGPKAKPSPAELRAAWAREAAEHGFGREAAGELRDAADRKRAKGVRMPDRRSPEALEFRSLFVAHLCREHAYVPEAHAWRTALQLAVESLDAPATGTVVS